MLLVEDTRQKAGKHEVKHGYWNEHGIVWTRTTLPFGDYWAAPKTAVDTKQGIMEIAANLCGAFKEKRRFDEECKKAMFAGTKLIFLIEETRFRVPEDLLGKQIYIMNGQTIPGDQVYLAMKMHEERYGCEFWFCEPEEAGRVIEELLSDG